MHKLIHQKSSNIYILNKKTWVTKDNIFPFTYIQIIIFVNKHDSKNEGKKPLSVT